MQEFRNLSTKAFIAVDNVVSPMLGGAISRTPQTRRRLIKTSNLMSVGGVLLMASDVALAATGNGLGGWIKSLVNETGVPLLEGFMWGGYGVGLAGVGTGINKFVQMTKPNGQATPKEGFAYLGGGGALMSLGYLAERSMESMTNNGGSSFTAKTL